MMRDAIAIRYDRDLEVGRNKPVLLACDVDGKSVEIIAKFSHRCERRTNALVAEAISAMLAADLDLPVPEPFVVRLDPDLELVMGELMPDWPNQQGLPAYGSTRLPPGYSSLPVGKAIPVALLSLAAEIFTYDVVIDNSDRLPRNPNCLSDGKSFAIIDHELAFPSGILGWRPPWEPNALSYMGTDPSKHLFFDNLRGKTFDLNRLSGAMEAIGDERLMEYIECLPPEWLGVDSEHMRMKQHIASSRDHIIGIVEQVLAVLS